jgi:hypothetical protein
MIEVVARKFEQAGWWLVQEFLGLLGERRPGVGSGHELDSPVGGMGLALHEAGPLEVIDQRGQVGRIDA